MEVIQVNLKGGLTMGDHIAGNQNEHEFETFIETEGRSVGKMRSEITGSRPGGDVFQHGFQLGFHCSRIWISAFCGSGCDDDDLCQSGIPVVR